MKLYINLAQQTASNDLPDQSENKMLSSFDDVCRTDIDDTASDSFRRLDDDIVVFRHLEVVERFWGTCSL